MSETFDYIVVGAGTAGCVLANRLTEDGRSTVLLLEAGGSDLSIWIQMPIGYGRTFFDKRINWMYDTEAVEGLGGRSSYWPRGKVIGGSGSINAMVYVARAVRAISTTGARRAIPAGLGRCPALLHRERGFRPASARTTGAAGRST